MTGQRIFSKAEAEAAPESRVSTGKNKAEWAEWEWESEQSSSPSNQSSIQLLVLERELFLVHGKDATLPGMIHEPWSRICRVACSFAVKALLFSWFLGRHVQSELSSCRCVWAAANGDGGIGPGPLGAPLEA